MALANASQAVAQINAVPAAERNLRFGIKQGRAIYNDFCAGWHGLRGEGGAGGPSLRNETSRKDVPQIMDWIQHPDPPMPAMYLHPLMDAEVHEVAGYVAGLK